MIPTRPNQALQRTGASLPDLLWFRVTYSSSGSAPVAELDTLGRFTHMKKTRCVIQFLALPFAVVSAFFLSGLIGSMAVSQFTNWTEPFVGPCCAASVIAVTFWLAPVRKRTFGIFVMVLGVLSAWFLLRDSYYPAPHPKAYEPTLIPLVTTVVAGVLSYLFCSIYWPHERFQK